jgi:hypothetical protein
MPPFLDFWVPPVPAWLTLAFFSFCPAHPDSFVFAGWSLTTPEAGCLRSSPSAGVLELLAPCSGVSELLTLSLSRGHRCYLRQISRYWFLSDLG